MKFRHLTLDDREAIARIVSASGYEGEDYVFSCMFLLSEVEEHYVMTLYDHLAIVKFKFENCTQYLPICRPEDACQVISLIREDCQESGHPLMITYIEERLAQAIEKAYPQQFTIRPMGRYDDYIYAIKDMAEMYGTSNRFKRQWVNRFEKTYSDYRLDSVTTENLHLCSTVLDRWIEMKKQHARFLDDLDLNLCRKAIEQFSTLQLSGKLLMVGNEPVSFMIYDYIRPNMVVGLFEKTDYTFLGAARMLEHSCAIEWAKEGVEWFNYGDDNFSEALKQTKKNLHPSRMIVKFEVVE